jgi:hypothetical protein
MPVSYKCEMCTQTADSLVGWLLLSVLFVHMNAEAPTPPSGRTLDATAPDLLFHNAACREAWCTKAGLAVPDGAGGASAA